MARVISEELLFYVPPIISINISSMDKRRRNLWRYNKNLGAYEIKKRHGTVNLFYQFCLGQLCNKAAILQSSKYLSSHRHPMLTSTLMTYEWVKDATRNVMERKDYLFM